MEIDNLLAYYAFDMQNGRKGIDKPHIPCLQVVSIDVLSDYGKLFYSLVFGRSNFLNLQMTRCITLLDRGQLTNPSQVR